VPVLAILSAVTALVAWGRMRPAAFIVDPDVPAFRTAQNPAQVLQTVMSTPCYWVSPSC
jgi:hypothetical protein